MSTVMKLWCVCVCERTGTISIHSNVHPVVAEIRHEREFIVRKKDEQVWFRPLAQILKHEEDARCHVKWVKEFEKNQVAKKCA